MNKEFFKNLSSLSHSKPTNNLEFKEIDSIHIFRCAFIEQMIEYNSVLDFAEVPEGSVKGNHILDFKGYSQELYLLHLFTKPYQKDVIVFFSQKLNSQHQCIGFGPSYYGVFTRSRNRVQFFHELSLKQSVSSFYLRKKGNPIDLYFYFNNQVWVSPVGPILVFSFWEYSPTKVTTIIDGSFNKISGDKPLIISVDAIFKDSAALLFKYIGSLDFTRNP